MASTYATPSLLLPADRFYRVALFGLVLTAVAALISTGKLDLFTCVLAPAAILYKGFRWARGHTAEWSQAMATRLVVGYLLFLPVDALLISRSLAAGSTNPSLFAALLAAVHFLLFVTIVRLYSASTDRDALFLSMLSFAGILASAVFTVDSYFFLFFLVFLIFGVATFVGLEIRRGATGAVFPFIQPRSEDERRFHRALFFAAVSVATGAVAMGSLLFFFFPRFSAGYFARAGLQSSFMSGFTDNIELGQIGEIKKNTSVVMRVQTGAPINYPMLRWRGIALQKFDGRRWTGDRTPRTVQSPSVDGWIEVTKQSEISHSPVEEIHFTVLMQPMASDALFAPAQLMAIRGNFSGDSVQRGNVDSDGAGSLYNPYRNFSEVRYEGVSLLPVARPSAARNAGTNYPDEIRNLYLQLPSNIDPRIQALAQKVTASADNPFDKSIELETYLRRNFAYTLTLSGKPGDDPLARFLFVTKAGHCEYFASSMAVMLRTLGIPSRAVNGFLPGEFNDVAGDYIVRESDAHSWVEAYFPGSGWVTFDPTPPAPATSIGLLSRMGEYLDWMQLTWNEWIINYDFSHQLLLAKNVHQSSTDWNTTLRNWFRRTQDRGMHKLTAWQVSHGKMSVLLPAVLVLGLLMLRMDWIRKFFRWLNFSWQVRLLPEQRNNPQLASRLYAELLRVLEKRGFVRSPSQTPGELAVAVALRPELAPAVREFTDLYAQARFGGAPCEALRLRSLLQQIRAVPR
jgi:protein-glutamine gamma-glutamyltransferase